MNPGFEGGEKATAPVACAEDDDDDDDVPPLDNEKYEGLSVNIYIPSFVSSHFFFFFFFFFFPILP